MKKGFSTNQGVNLALFQIRLTLIGPGLLGPATMLINKAVRV